VRLRYLHLEGVPPLTDLRVIFGHEPVLGREVAIRFVVGVNGSGKTRFLQALADIFLHLERPSFPPFPVTLAYDLGASNEMRTIYLRHRPGETATSAFIEFARSLDVKGEQEWEELPELKERDTSGRYPVKGELYLQGNLPGSGAVSAFLPKALLAYTSGATARWQEIFYPAPPPDEYLPDTVMPEDERPLQWNIVNERRYQAESETSTELSEWKRDEAGAGRATGIGHFVRPEELKLAVCAVTLEQALKDFKTIRNYGEARFLDSIKQEKTGLRAILNAVDWLHPVAISMRLQLELERLSKEQSGQLAELFHCATTVLRDPAGQPGRLAVFDLLRPLPEREADDTSTAAALIDALTPETPEPFAIFRSLQNWREVGVLTDVNMAVRKRNLDDLLLYDWLSDGEKMFLGRMALLHLFKRQEDAMIILDEPETHFNDYWKRQIVDIIDDNLRDVASEVVISTHSSIALTDVFDTEITLLKKSERDGSINAESPMIHTFGASPSEIMRKVFEAPDVVGQRANEFLDMVLKVAASPPQVENIWRAFSATERLADNMPDIYESLSRSEDFINLWEKVKVIHTYENDRRLYNLLLSLWYQARREKPDLILVRVVDVLRMMEEKIGPGYYRFEFNRRLQALEEMNGDVA
jgi:energy-coupling factor transporter ATP-binding protein EcfA2